MTDKDRIRELLNSYFLGDDILLLLERDFPDPRKRLAVLLIMQKVELAIAEQRAMVGRLQQSQ